MAIPAKFRVGLIGAGQISRFHLQALGRIPDAQVVGVHDLQREASCELARSSRNLRVYDSCDDLLRDANVVHVLTPPASHAELALQAIAAGCDVFVEKPLATSVADCARIAQAAAEAGRTVGVDHSLLKDPFTRRALEWVQRGKIGRVVAVDCLRSQDYPDYLGGPTPDYAREGGFPFRDLGIHALYQIEAFLGPIDEVTGMFGKFGDDPLLPFDEWRAVARCARGLAQVQLSWNARPLQDLLVIQGTTGILRLDRFGMHVTVRPKRRLPEHPQRVINALSEGIQAAWQLPWNLARVATGRIRRYHGLQEMVAEFYDCLRTGRTPSGDLDTARRISHWLESLASEADRAQQRQLAHFAQPPTAPTLVTGASGLIGRHLVRRLLAEGRRIRILARRPPPSAWQADARIEVVLGDLGDPQAVDRAVAGSQIVYHVGGTVRGSAAEFWRGNVAGTQNVVDSCVRHGVRQLIYISSLSVLQAPGRSGGTLDEDSALEPYPERRGLYTQTKCRAEEIVVRAVAERSLPAVIVRPAEVVGDGGPVLSSGVGQRHGSRLLIFGNGRLHVPLIQADDLIDALVRCEEHCIRDGTILHLVDPQPLTQNALAAKYATASGVSLQIHHLPRPLVMTLGLAVQTVCGALRRPAPVSVYRLRSALAPRQFSIQRAVDVLQWQPRCGVPPDRDPAPSSAAASELAVGEVEVERVG